MEMWRIEKDQIEKMSGMTIMAMRLIDMAILDEKGKDFYLLMLNNSFLLTASQMIKYGKTYNSGEWIERGQLLDEAANMVLGLLIGVCTKEGWTKVMDKVFEMLVSCL